MERGSHLSARRLMDTTRTTRRVWAMVTKEPRASRRDIARRLRVPLSTVHHALHRLRDAGYIDFEDYTTGTNRILVPFIALR